MANRKRLTSAEHEDLAARVKATRDLLMQINLIVGRGLGSSCPASRAAERILNDFDLKFKHEISKVADRDCPELDALALYYGPNDENRIVHISHKPRPVNRT